MSNTIAGLTRLRFTIEAINNGKPNDAAGEALRTQYNRLSSEVRALLPAHLHDEFDRLFPQMEDTVLRPTDLLERQVVAASARTNLLSLTGWIQGQIEAEKHQ